MSIEYTIYATKLRDTFASRIAPEMLRVAMDAAAESDGEISFDDNDISRMTWELADAMIRTREARYGPTIGLPEQPVAKDG